MNILSVELDEHLDETAFVTSPPAGGSADRRELLVLAGTATLRHAEGDDPLVAGDLACLPEGPAGAHQLLDRGESAVRALFLSTTGVPANAYYPDTGQWLIRNERYQSPSPIWPARR